MADIDKDLIERFKKVVMRLPEDKRKAMYERLKSMSDEERNAAMKAIVAKAEEAGRSAPSSDDKAAPAPRHNTDKRAVHSPEHTPRAVKRLKPQYRNMLIGIFAFLAVLLIGIEVYRNLDKIRGTVPAQTEVSASESETIQTETTTTEATEPEPTEAPTATPTPAPTSVPIAADAPDLTGLVIVIDPGHQGETSEELENCATWLSVEKPGCTAGGEGVVTGIRESELTLQYALVMRDYLEQCGATVILTRESDDVDISNQERAAIAVDNNADVFIRLHADSANDSMQSGVRVYVPDSGNYTSQNIAWGDTLGTAVAEAEGLEFVGTRQTYLYTGLNYANSVPSFQISLGFLSNSDDESVIVSEENMIAVADAAADFCADFKE